MIEFIGDIAGALTRPFLSADARTYAPFVALSWLAAVIYVLARQTKQDTNPSPSQLGRLANAIKIVTPKSVYFHSSSMLDLQLYALGVAVKASLASLKIVLTTAVAIMTSTCFQIFWGVSSPLSLSPTFLMTIYALGAFIIEDFTRFYLHWLQHKIPLLWRFHRVHHSAEVLTPLTLYRFHPVEIFCFFMRHVLVFGVVSGFAHYLTAGAISMMTILGVNVFSLAFNAALANLRHSHIPISWRPLEWLFISPMQHQEDH